MLVRQAIRPGRPLFSWPYNVTIFVVAAFVSIVTFIISIIIEVNFIIFDNSSINYIKEINISSLKANSLSESLDR